MNPPIVEKAFELLEKDQSFYKPRIRAGGIFSSADHGLKPIREVTIRVSGRFRTPQHLALALRCEFYDEWIREELSIPRSPGKADDDLFERYKTLNTMLLFVHLAETECDTKEEMLENARQHPEHFWEAVKRVGDFLVRSGMNLERPLYDLALRKPDEAKQLYRESSLSDFEKAEIRKGLDNARKPKKKLFTGRAAEIALALNWLPYSLWLPKSNRELFERLKDRGLIDNIVDPNIYRPRNERTGPGPWGKDLQARQRELDHAVHNSHLNDFRSGRDLIE